MYYHGAGLAAIGLSLAAAFRRILIPSTHTFRHLFAWGSHSLLDPLWSTERTEIVLENIDGLVMLHRVWLAGDAYGYELPVQ